MDVYVFIRNTSSGLVDAIRASRPQAVRFVALTTGEYAAFAVVEVDGLGDLPEVLDLLREAGAQTGEETAVSLRPGARRVRHSLPIAAGAIVRIRVESGRGREVLGAVSVVDGATGSAVVAGVADVIVEITADDEETLLERLLNQLHGIPGIAASDSGLYIDHYHRDEQEAKGA